MEQPEIIGIDLQQGVTIVTFLVPSISTPADVDSVSAKLLRERPPIFNILGCKKQNLENAVQKNKNLGAYVFGD